VNVGIVGSLERSIQHGVTNSSYLLFNSIILTVMEIKGNHLFTSSTCGRKTTLANGGNSALAL